MEVIRLEGQKENCTSAPFFLGTSSQQIANRELPIHLLQPFHVTLLSVPSLPFAPLLEGVKWCLNLVPGPLPLTACSSPMPRREKEIWAHGTIFHWQPLDIDG